MSFIDMLHSTAPAADQADRMGLYGWLIGDWEMAATLFLGGAEHTAQGTIHFGWVLEGTAIQDVWILPGYFGGTTLRVYDPGLDAWHILWSDPLKQYYSRQVGRADGKDIVQLGRVLLKVSYIIARVRRGIRTELVVVFQYRLLICHPRKVDCTAE